MLITKTITISQNGAELEFGIKKPTAYRLLILVNQLLNALHVTPEILNIDQANGLDAIASIRQLIYNMLQTGIEIDNTSISDVQLSMPLLDFVITNALTNPDEHIVEKLQASLAQCIVYNEKAIKLEDLAGVIKKPIQLWNLFIEITRHCLEEFFVKKQ